MLDAGDEGGKGDILLFTANPDSTSAVTRAYNGLMRLTRESQAIEEDAARHVGYAYDDAPTTR